MKMNFSELLKKGLSVGLALTTLFAAACTQDNVGGVTPPPEINGDGALEDTGKYIVEENGTSEYTILLPEKTDDQLELAAVELQYGIEQTCGYKMKITTEYDSAKKYLSIGETELYQENKSVVDADKLEEQELRVVTVEDDVIMVGGSSVGSLYAVYEFMEKSFHFKWYTFEDAYIEKTESIKLYKLDENDAPDLYLRSEYQWDYWVEDELRRESRMKYYTGLGYYTDAHNMVNEIVPKSMYLEAHPEWFTVKDGTTGVYCGQLCLTNEELIATFIERCKQIIISKGVDTADWFCIGMEDNWDYCKCENCTALAASISPTGKEIPNHRTGNFIVFINKIEKAINEWIKEYDSNKVIKFKMYAYFHNKVAPVKEVDGKYEPASPDVVLNSNTYVFYAPLNDDHSYAYDDERNTTISKDLKQWEAVAKNIICRSYNINYGHEFGWLPMNDLLTMGSAYKNAAAKGYGGYMEEGKTYYRQSSMQRLKNYVASELWWDGDAGSVDELAYEFIDFYYAPVAQEFKEYYAALKQFQIYQRDVLGLRTYIMAPSYADAQYWPYDAMVMFNGMLDDMLEKLKALQAHDPDLYEQYFHRVNIEKLWVYFMFCTSYGANFSKSEYNEMVDFCAKYGLEYKTVSGENMATIESWRN